MYAHVAFFRTKQHFFFDIYMLLLRSEENVSITKNFVLSNKWVKNCAASSQRLC